MERKTLAGIIIIASVSAGVLLSISFSPESKTDNNQEKTNWKTDTNNSSLKKATFAGGCFWCMEAVYENQEGVKAAISGFAGGRKETANYDQVLTGTTDHREAVRVRYNSSKISYRELLDIYWKSIDPTDPGGQFTDRGPQYTTAIYAHNKNQRRLANQSEENLSESGKFEDPIVTEIQNFTTFFRAKDKHQNYSRKNAVQYKAYERASGRKGFVERVWENSPFSKK